MSRDRPQITFDSNLAGVAGTRAFWGTLCEEIGQALVLTPTAAREVVRRVRLETEREWSMKLKGINTGQAMGWTKVEIRRLATTAANAMAESMTGGVKPYLCQDLAKMGDRPLTYAVEYRDHQGKLLSRVAMHANDC